MKRFSSLFAVLALASVAAIGCGPGEPDIPAEGEGQKIENTELNADDNSAEMKLDEEIPGGE